jgi:hypothetical protein
LEADSTRTRTSRRSAALARGQPIHRFFDTLKSTHSIGWFPPSTAVTKPMREGFVEARSQDRWGEHLEEVNAKRGSAAGSRVTPVRLVRTPWMRKSLKPHAGKVSTWQVAEPASRRHEGQEAPRGVARYRGGKTSESENPRALPARNKAGQVAGGTKRQEVEKT